LKTSWNRYVFRDSSDEEDEINREEEENDSSDDDLNFYSYP